MTNRQTLVVKGRRGIQVTIVVEVYRGKVWIIAVEPSFTSEAISNRSRLSAWSTCSPKPPEKRAATSQTTHHETRRGHAQNSTDGLGFTIRWRHGDREAAVLRGNQVGNWTMDGLLGTIPVPVTGWTDLAEIRMAGGNDSAPAQGCGWRGRGWQRGQL